ncbi:hypothetical protein SEA_LILBEANIE_10 [Gordonia phage Lilbeanie]|uniref:Uncharacterized protein n=1 Tax=Gordonia phage Lilbeanie TaxID=2794947 RepID=A0A7T1KSB4_9CAUD|nr:HNH endonuclease [Gordonia phage Lilbeanie]QPO17088.1 hypothetical protein SEA_LILBEANIE_10 [Gordonia phage Lilbeanie]
MDPNAALEEIRLLADKSGTTDLVPAESDRLAELIAGLDRWLTGGGFLPTDWAR